MLSDMLQCLLEKQLIIFSLSDIQQNVGVCCFDLLFLVDLRLFSNVSIKHCKISLRNLYTVPVK